MDTTSNAAVAVLDDERFALERWLDENDKTQAWLASEVGVKPPSLHAWLKSGEVPFKKVPAVAAITGLSKAELNPLFAE